MLQIPLLIEPPYGESHWARAYAQGIREEAHRRGRTVVPIAPEQAPDGRPLLVLGSTNAWLSHCLAYLSGRGIPCVVAGVPPEDRQCAFAAPDYEAATARFLSLSAPHPPALFAVHPDSAADRVKREAFAKRCPGGAVYANTGSLLTAARMMAAQSATVGAVLCANDVAAMVLGRVLAAAGQSPALYAFGDQRLPPEEGIAVFQIDLTGAGRQAVRLYRALEREGTDAPRRCAWVPCPLLTPTPAPPEEAPPARPAPAVAGDFYRDPQVPQIFRFKALLSGCDSLDLDILRELLTGSRYFTAAERLHTTENTIKYRLKGMMARAEAATREELLALAADYLSPEGDPSIK